ncbi:META domain-containing protein [Microvirga sp. W0021]|uniref:META domain-containing protein n=1 Tax=Hohaiivirga grylli TaxID=3133970 RepID=A0ABV0BPT2_9HYPH
MFQSIAQKFILAASCLFLPLTASYASPSAISGEWQVEKISTENVTADIETTLNITEDGKVNGSGGCNRYVGSADIQDDTISFSQMASTRMACMEPAMAREQTYLKALETVKGWKIEDGKLVLIDSEKKPVIVLHKLEKQTSITIEVPGNIEVNRTTATYTCGDVPVDVTYINADPHALAVLSVKNKTVIMSNVIAASGAKYAGGQYTWWTQKEGAEFYDLTSGDKAKPVNCIETGTTSSLD